MWILFLLCHRCLLGSIPEGKFTVITSLLAGTEQRRKPFKLHFNTDYLKKDDPKQCTKVGEIITWELGTFNCTENDILTDKKLEILEDSLAKTTEVFHNLINVTRFATKIAPSKGTLDIPFKAKNLNTDLYVMVVSRPFGSTNFDSVAIGTTSDISAIDGRPITGALYINTRAIPRRKSGFNSSASRAFINGITHEMFHILGIRGSLMHTWINRSTGLPYEVLPVTSYVSPKYNNKKFILLQTPSSNSVAQKFFNTTYFADGLLAGIELEDDPSPLGMSHPEARLYSSDLMAAETAGTAIISQISLAMLLDTGWYDVNFELTENLPPPLGGPLDSPALFTKHAQCTKEDAGKKVCSSYLRYPAYCMKPTEIKCPGNPYFCSSRDFFDPNNTGIGGSRVFDYMIKKRFIPGEEGEADATDRFCTNSDNDGEHPETGQEFSSESMCAMSSLNSEEKSNEETPICYRMRCVNSSLFVIVNGSKYHCEYEDQRITVDGYNGALVCPDPEFVCYVKDYLGRKWTNPVLPQLRVISPIDSFVKAVIIFVCCVILIVITMSVIWCCWPLPENLDISTYKSLPGGRRLASRRG